MNIRTGLRHLRASGWWKPATAAHLLRTARSLHVVGEPRDDDHSLRAAAGWLARAQDATPDGGISGRYRLAGGWTSSYPETTGYCIPTLLTLAAVLGDESFRDRAQRAVDFLLSVQLPDGGFPGLEIADNRTSPSPFNTAQIIHGLHRWHLATGDVRVLDPIRRAGHWMCDVQDPDGPWRKHWYRGLACAYSSHAACWLADAGDTLGDRRFLDAAERNLRWVLAQHDPRTGWFDRSGFSEDDHRLRRAHTHTIAYTLDGVLRLAQRFGVDEGVSAVRTACERLMLRFERSRTLAGVLNFDWRAQCAYVCLTGNAQIASIWLKLARAEGDLRFANAAFKALDQVKRAQAVDHRDPGIRGGIPGSAPIGGNYIQYALPNWAAKFFVDAVCAKRECLTGWINEARHPLVRAANAIEARSFAGERRSERAGREPAAPITVVAFTTRISPTFANLAERWQARRFSPALVVIETADASRARRLAASARRRADDSARVCRAFGWRFLTASTVNDAEVISAIERLKPDLAVAAGAGIVRQRTLAIPRLGTVNAHMGVLPAYRGMNVAEWSALNGDPIGCSVFLIDEGIDTGPIVAVRGVETAGAATIAELRARVNNAQLDLLDDTLRTIAETASRPDCTAQRLEEGRQFFRMHADLRAVLEQELRRKAAMAERLS